MSAEKRKSKPAKQQGPIIPFGRRNYIIIGGGVAVLVLGFLLMAADTEFVDSTKFSLSLWVAPIVLVLGFVAIGFGILYRDPSIDEGDDA